MANAVQRNQRNKVTVRPIAGRGPTSATRGNRLRNAIEEPGISLLGESPRERTGIIRPLRERAREAMTAPS